MDASDLSTESARQGQESTEMLASPPTPRRPSRTTHRSRTPTSCEVGETAEGSRVPVEVELGDAADLFDARRYDPDLVGGLRADLEGDPAEALVGRGEARRVDDEAELVEPAETAGRGRAVDSGAEVTTMEETKLAELVTGAADAADSEGGTELDAATRTDAHRRPSTGVR
ncbi:unnamed protein product [Phytophthora fragariaefolia]|uniref:Unnamed protein product n=1 Tax=Phytophthora fragariaefolia TaxID=1490495 RepID=A0A9W6Y2N1_9STRA|nr:unnamed protein product [Phytophthora fragariaefolia]